MKQAEQKRATNKAEQNTERRAHQTGSAKDLIPTTNDRIFY